MIENLKYKNLRIPSVKLSKEYASVAMLIYQDKELVLINTAGGITCNDSIEINATIHNSELI